MYSTFYNQIKIEILFMTTTISTEQNANDYQINVKRRIL